MCIMVRRRTTVGFHVNDYMDVLAMSGVGTEMASKRKNKFQ